MSKDKNVGKEGDRVTAALQVFSSDNALAKYCLTDTALIMPDGCDFATVERMLRGMKIVSDCVRFWMGDLLLYAERNFGEMYSQLLDETDYAYQSLKDMAWVANAIAPQTRRSELTWSHHREVAKLDQAKQELYLDQAVLNSMSVKVLRDTILKEECRKPEKKVKKVDAFEAALNDIVSILNDNSSPDVQLRTVKEIATGSLDKYRS